MPDLSLAQAAVSTSRPVVTIALSWQDIDDAASLVWGVADPSIAAIEVAASSGTVAATVVDGIWAVWWPGSGAESAEIRAMNSMGERVVDEAATRLAMPLPDPSSIVDAVGIDGTNLERSVLADGSVTWTEFQLALDAWQACVAVAGYELTIEVDQATRSYQAISPTVSVAAELGQPDDVAGEALLAPVMEVIDACYETELRRIAQVHAQQ